MVNYLDCDLKIWANCLHKSVSIKAYKKWTQPYFLLACVAQKRLYLSSLIFILPCAVQVRIVTVAALVKSLHCLSNQLFCYFVGDQVGSETQGRPTTTR